jgi:hypothetical protein
MGRIVVVANYAMISMRRRGIRFRRGCSSRMKVAPPRFCRGDCGWAGRAGEPLLGARGARRRGNDMLTMLHCKSTNCGRPVTAKSPRHLPKTTTSPIPRSDTARGKKAVSRGRVRGERPLQSTACEMLDMQQPRGIASRSPVSPNGSGAGFCLRNRGSAAALTRRTQGEGRPRALRARRRPRGALRYTTPTGGPMVRTRH